MVTPVPAIVSRLDVVFLYVPDMRTALALYRDLLGIPLEADDRWADADVGGTRSALHRLREGVVEPSSGGDWRAASGVTDPDGHLVHLDEPAGRR